MMDMRKVEPGDRSAARNFLRLHPVSTFYLLAFFISWAGYAPVLAAGWGVAFFRSQLWMIFLVLPATGPALAAWIAGSGTPGGLSRLRRSFLRRVGWVWWPVAILLPLTMSVVAESLATWLAPARTPKAQPAPFLGVLVTVMMSLCANPWEEVGWRGFALTRLQARYHGWRAALIIGVLSALWHIPLFLWTGSPMSRIPFSTWAPGVVGESFILAWLFNRTGRSLAIVSLFHISFNIAGAVLGVRSHLIMSGVEIALGLLLALSSGPSLGLRQNETYASTSP